MEKMKRSDFFFFWVVVVWIGMRWDEFDCGFGFCSFGVVEISELKFLLL